jgi:hypothetical protein
MFDALITLFWLSCDRVREAAQKELVEFMKKKTCGLQKTISTKLHYHPQILLTNKEASKECLLQMI